MKRSNLAPLLLVVAVGACAVPAAQESPELAATTNVWEEALNTGDIAALTAMYTEDARLLPPNAELSQGRDAVEALFGGMIAAGLKVELEAIEAVVAGDLGYKVGTYSLLGPDGAVLDGGKFIEIWRQVDGEWQVANDIWNSDTPGALSGTTLLITHEVADAARWLAAWRGAGSRHELFAQHGAPFVRTFQSAANPRLTGLLIDVADMAAFEAFMESPEATKSKAEDGVIDATLRVFTQMQ